MSEEEQQPSHAARDEEAKVPLGQRLLGRPILLLVVGILVMVVFYTLWGLFEIATLPTSKLP